MKKTKLFCIPYAGGSAMTYSKWNKFLDSSIELYPLELPGRGKRFQEPFYTSVAEATNGLFSQIKDLFDKAPYALFGHSMGSIITYELYYKIIECNLPKPLHIFFSGRGAPHLTRDEEPVYQLPYNEFVEKILELGGTPKEVFENDELKNIFIPILRNDYRLIDTYEYVERDAKIDCDTTILVGNEDDITQEEIEGWKLHTTEESQIFYFQGGHFFINDYPQNIVEIINNSLLNNANTIYI